MHLLFLVMTEMMLRTYSKVAIIFRSRKMKTDCGSDKIKAAADKNIYKEGYGYLPNRSKKTLPLNTKQWKEVSQGL